MRRRRRRSLTVNIQVTFLSWVIEFIVGNSLIAVAHWGNKRFLPWHRLFDLGLMFVVLPCTYVLNREVTKQIISLRNWSQGIRSIFLPTGQVAPMARGDAAPHDPPVPARNVSPTHQPLAPAVLAAQTSDISPPISPPIPPDTETSNVSFGNQQNIDTIPLSSIRVIQVKSASR